MSQAQSPESSQQLWSDVDTYLEQQQIEHDDALDHALQAASQAGLPAHLAVSASQGKFLQLLAQIHGAKKILEIGTLAGYSTIWLARALPADGKMISLEFSPNNAELARSNLAYAGLADKVEIRAGNAVDTLPLVEADGLGPFDLIFVDADKSGYKHYLDWALKLSRPGTVIIMDNVIRGGGILDAENHLRSRTMLGLREYFDHLSQQKRLTATTMQTVGNKGHDGFTLAVVL